MPKASNGRYPAGPAPGAMVGLWGWRPGSVALAVAIWVPILVAPVTLFSRRRASSVLSAVTSVLDRLLFCTVTVQVDSPVFRGMVAGAQVWSTGTMPSWRKKATGRCSAREPPTCLRFTWPKYCPSGRSGAVMTTVSFMLLPGATVKRAGSTVMFAPLTVVAEAEKVSDLLGVFVTVRLAGMR